MRTINMSVLSSLNLSAEEVEFLAPKATEQHAKHCEKYSYAPDPKRDFSKWLSLYGPKGLSHAEHIGLQLMHALANRKRGYPSVREIQTQTFEGGYGTHHSSYGSISLGVPSSNRMALVGSSTLASHFMQFDVQFGRLYLNDGKSAHLMHDIGILRAAMSVEQFSLLIRGGDGVKAPAKLQVIAEGMGDEPPTLAPTHSNQKNFEEEVRQAAQPFILVIKSIYDLMKSDLGKKANRVALGEAGKAAQLALDAVKKEISALTVLASEKETARVQRQFDAEVNDRLKTMGIENLAEIIPRLT
jgi:hypothetical protein